MGKIDLCGRLNAEYGLLGRQTKVNAIKIAFEYLRLGEVLLDSSGKSQKEQVAIRATFQIERILGELLGDRSASSHFTAAKVAPEFAPHSDIVIAIMLIETRVLAADERLKNMGRHLANRNGTLNRIRRDSGIGKPRQIKCRRLVHCGQNTGKVEKHRAANRNYHADSQSRHEH